MLLILALACTGSPMDTAVEDTAGGLAGDASNGQVLFASACAGCHGTDGRGGQDIGGAVSADLSVAIPMMTDLALEGVIVNGVGSAMPPQFTEPEDIADVIAYLRATFP